MSTHHASITRHGKYLSFRIDDGRTGEEPGDDVEKLKDYLKLNADVGTFSVVDHRPKQAVIILHGHCTGFTVEGPGGATGSEPGDCLEGVKEMLRNKYEVTEFEVIDARDNSGNLKRENKNLAKELALARDALRGVPVILHAMNMEGVKMEFLADIMQACLEAGYNSGFNDGMGLK
jgi:hypothetical protein